MFQAVADKIWCQKATKKQKKRVAIVGGMHGDEPEGIALIESLLAKKESYWEDAIFDVTLALGNPDAITSSKRVDRAQTDLNRAFGAESISNMHPRARILQETLRDADIILDIHQTHLPIDACVVCPKTPAHLQLALHLGAKQVVTGTEKIFGANMLSDWANQQGRLGLTFETGQAGTEQALEVARIAVDQLLFEPIQTQTERLVNALLLWEVVDVLPAPGKDYQFLRPFRNGSRVAKGEVIAEACGQHTKALVDGAIFLPRTGQEAGSPCCIQVQATDWP